MREGRRGEGKERRETVWPCIILRWLQWGRREIRREEKKVKERLADTATHNTHHMLHTTHINTSTSHIDDHMV